MAATNQNVPTKKRRSSYTAKTKKSKRVKPAQIAKLAARLKRFGEYPVKGNSLVDGGLPDAAIMRSADNGDIVVRHREYIMDVLPTDDFTIQANLAINPGLETLFPWLSSVAECYEEYDIRGLVFEYKSLSSDAVLSAAASTSLGTVSMATQYNVNEDPFTSKRELLNYQFANSSKPSMSFLHPVDCKNGRNPLSRLWVRTANTSLADQDRRLYDLGDFILATEGCQGAAAGGSIGELWATIEVVLSKSKLAVVGQTDVFQNATGVAVASAFGTNANRLAGEKNNVNGSFNGTTDEYTFPTGSVGSYLIYYEVTGTAAALTNAGFTVSGGIAGGSDIWGALGIANESPTPVTGTTSTKMCMIATVTLDPTLGPGIVGIDAGCVFPTNPTLMVFIVTRMNSNMSDLSPY